MKIQVKKLEAKAEVCLMAKKIFDDLNLSTEVKYNIHVGQLNKYSYIRPNNTKDSCMYFTGPIFNGLLLYSNANLNIWRKDNDIYLGPVVGVLVNTRYLKAIEELDPPISCQKNMQANEEGNCLLYYFSIENVNWVKNKIKGFTFVKELNMWKHYWFPMPDVVYDRGTRFDIDQKLLVKHIRRQFGYHPRIHLINSKDYLDKWRSYKYLSKHSEIISYLPKTILYTSFQDVLNMLKEYEFIFLKGSYGSMGREVLSMEQVGEKYKINFYSDGLKDKLLDREQLQRFVNKFINGKHYIVQQGCRLMKHEGRNMDMRVLINKDGSGKWRAIYNECRIANKDSTITNYSAGGWLANYEDIYPNLKRQNPNINIPSYDEIADITIKIATYIDKEFGSFGEIGMDMALDKDGKLWFIEANSKPDKDPEPGLEDTEGISPQCLYVLQYAKFLVGGE